MSEAPVHGGDLAFAEREFGPPPEPWQDLSTGISPWPYPVGPVPETLWQTLPGQGESLMAAASRHYRVPPAQLLAVPGSQYALARLPALLSPGPVAVPEPGYGEHALAWQRAGHRLVTYAHARELEALAEAGRVHHAVVINPNNPTGECVDSALLGRVHRAIEGTLLVDEAFADAVDQTSAMVHLSEWERLVVTRSVGKFFGLAGVRLGFVASAGQSLIDLQSAMDPWAVSHPAQWVGARALADRDWQQAQRARIRREQQRLVTVLRDCLGSSVGVTSAGLFATLTGPRARLYGLYQHLGRRGLFTRWCHTTSGPAWLRIGLPPDGGRRLSGALEQWESQ